MHTLEPSRWDDLRIFLAVMREGSFTAAASALGVEQSTVSRRIASLETELGAGLFDRTPLGPRPTELAERLRAHAERVEAEVRAFADAASGHEREPKGRVRLALTESMAIHVVIPNVLRALREKHPELDVDLVTSDLATDLDRREADLAIRFFRPTQGDLVAKRVARMPMGVLARRDLAHRKRRKPEAFDWISFEIPGVPMPDAAWLAAHVKVPPRMRTTSYLSQVEAVRAGLGVAMLVRTLLRLDPELVELDLGLPPGPVLELWLVTPSNLRDVPRVAAVWDFLEARLGELGE